MDGDVRIMRWGCCRGLSRSGELVGLFHAGFEEARACLVGLFPAVGEVRLLSSGIWEVFVKNDDPSAACGLPKSAMLRDPRRLFALVGEPLTDSGLYPRSFAR